MAEYHVHCGCFGIYAGTVKKLKSGEIWNNKSEVTNEAIEAVRDWLVVELLGGFDCKKAASSGYEWKLKDGRIVKLGISIRDGDKEHD